MDNRPYEPSDALDSLAEALAAMRALNEEGSGWRDRQLSIAITDTETALLRAKAAFAAHGLNVSDW